MTWRATNPVFFYSLTFLLIHMCPVPMYLLPMYLVLTIVPRTNEPYVPLCFLCLCTSYLFCNKDLKSIAHLPHAFDGCSSSNRQYKEWFCFRVWKSCSSLGARRKGRKTCFLKKRSKRNGSIPGTWSGRTLRIPTRLLNPAELSQYTFCSCTLAESYPENIGRYALGFHTLPSGHMGKWHK